MDERWLHLKIRAWEYRAWRRAPSKSGISRGLTPPESTTFRRDGKMVLFVEMSYGPPRNTAVYLRNTDGSAAVHLGDGNRPQLSPDGKWVVCFVSDGPKTKLTLLPTGAGEAPPIPASGMHYERVEWFPDGQRLLFIGNEPGRPARTFVQDRNGGKPTPITPEGMKATRVSPDQKYVTVADDGKLNLLPIAGGAIAADRRLGSR